MESTGRRARRAFTDEYKAEVVELCRTSGKTIAAVPSLPSCSEALAPQQLLT